MEKLLKVLGVSDQENLGESISGRAFEKLFYEIIKQHKDFSKIELTWPVVTVADAKIFRNQIIKCLPLISNLTDNEGQKMSIRRSMLDDGLKSKIILEALARSILFQKIGDSSPNIDEELNRISALESEISKKSSIKALLCHDILKIEIPNVELNVDLWNYFSLINSQQFEVSFPLKKIVREMAERTLKEPIYPDEIRERITLLKFEKIKKIKELEKQRQSPFTNYIQLVPVPECFYNLNLPILPNDIIE
jgi:hypothetical protein